MGRRRRSWHSNDDNPGSVVPGNTSNFQHWNRRIDYAIEGHFQLFGTMDHLRNFGFKDRLSSRRFFVRFIDSDQQNSAVGVCEGDDLLSDVVSSDGADSFLILHPTIRAAVRC